MEIDREEESAAGWGGEGGSGREKEILEKEDCAQKMALTVNPIGFREN